MGLVVTVTIGIAALVIERNESLHFTISAIMAIVYLGLVASFAASGLYLILLRRYAVTSLAYLQIASAAIAAIVGILLGGEHLGPSPLIGTTLVIAGLFILVIQRPTRQALRSGTKTDG